MNTKKTVIELINSHVKSFCKKTQSKQGYIHIEFCNGIHVKSYGSITYRAQMSGAPDGYDEFRSLTNLEAIISNLSQRIESKGYKDFI